MTTNALKTTLSILARVGTQMGEGKPATVHQVDALAQLGWEPSALDWLLADISHVRAAWARCRGRLLAAQMDDEIAEVDGNITVVSGRIATAQRLLDSLQ